MLILGCDIGYGDTKVVAGSETGEISKKFKFPSMIGMTKKLENVENDRIKEYDGNFYMIGDDAKHLPSENIIDLTDYKNLEYFGPLLLQFAIDKVNLGQPDVIVTGLSIAQIDNSGYFQEKLSNYTINGEEFVNPKVIVLAQGSGAKVMNDIYGVNFPVKQEEFSGDKNFVIADIGFNTSDFVLVNNGKTDPNLFRAEEKSGIMKIAAKIAKLIHDRHGRSLSLMEAKQVLNEKVYRLRGQRYDYSAEISEFKKEYLKDLIKFIENSFPSIIDKLDFILLVGGGSTLFSGDSADKFIRIPKTENEFYNAIGDYLFGVQRI